jgi:gluconate 2-dehydrogenase gamma chain
MPDEKPKVITRRDLLRGAGIAAAAAALPGDMLAVPAAAPAVAVAAQNPAAALLREPLESLTAQEADLLDLISARLIPTDANGPGAREARAVRYIDRALGGALAASRDAYRSGLAAFDRYCLTARGRPFAELTPAEQDSVLVDVEAGAAGPGAGFAGSSAQFFAMVLNHTRQGTFGDPYYGGNANFVGWDLIGYPGVRTGVTAADQQALERNQLKPNRRSAYDNEMFNKATASAAHRGMPHGD